jgi:transcriptional regulator with XRE-family HTH domain
MEKPRHKLRAARYARGLSQSELAKKIGVTRGIISDWECGKVNPYPYHVGKLCSFFGVKDPAELDLVREIQDATSTPVGDQPDETTDASTHAAPPAMTEAVDQSEKEDHQDMDPLRRTIIKGLVSLGLTSDHLFFDSEFWERLVAARMQSAALSEETLNHFEHLLGICWDLTNTQELEVAEGILSSFLPKLLALPQKEGRIATLASHGLRLWSILSHHRLDLSHKVLLCEQSVDYAHRAHDPNTLVPALIELAGAYEYTNQPEKRFETFQEALYHSNHASPFIQSRAYSRNAVVLAESGRKREAQFYIGLAQEVFPDKPSKEPWFAFADSSIFRLSYHAGLVCVLTGEAAKADDAFELYKQHPSGLHIPERIRLEITNGKSKAAILMNDAERYADLLEDVIVSSANIGSKKRFDEAHRIFRDQVPASWLAHQRIQTLTEKYHLKREE